MNEEGQGKDYAVECDGCMRDFKLKNLREWGDGRIFCKTCYAVMDEERNA
jgi:hypothetical protein